MGLHHRKWNPWHQRGIDHATEGDLVTGGNAAPPHVFDRAKSVPQPQCPRQPSDLHQVLGENM